MKNEWRTRSIGEDRAENMTWDKGGEEKHRSVEDENIKEIIRGNARQPAKILLPPI
jgi:hypothetical protein